MSNIKMKSLKEMDFHKIGALKVLEHVTQKGISIDQYNNN